LLDCGRHSGRITTSRIRDAQLSCYREARSCRGIVQLIKASCKSRDNIDSDIGRRKPVAAAK
jgi:hypothetical protein